MAGERRTRALRHQHHFLIATMISLTEEFVTLGCLVFILSSSRAFQAASVMTHKARESLALNSQHAKECHRRQFLVRPVLSSLIVGQTPASADEDLTSQLFNPDGSLKEGVSSEVAKTRVVEFKWDQSDSPLVNMDGENVAGTVKGSQVRISYELPDKWGKGNQLYIDRSEGVNAPACKRITVYKTPGKASTDRLDKASIIGVGKALEATGDLEKMTNADIIGGRKQAKNGQKYYTFDMASAPNKCENRAQDDLGLGFCPYDTVFLISATVLNESLYVMVIECDNLEWKQGNADLKRVRSSFSVESVA